MIATFTDALAVVLKEEGGFVNNPQDPGGMTNLGVTARTWQSWTGHGVNEAIMRGLTPASVAPMYKAWFWDKVAGDALPIGLALAVFDFAVNAGPARAVKTLQGIVGAVKDGQPGTSTLNAVKAYVGSIGLAKIIKRYNDARLDFYQGLPTFPVFGHGWTARVDRINAEALSWV